MKTKVMLLLLVLAASANGMFAQDQAATERRKARFEKFQAERMEFLSKAMDLTKEERAAFWPLDKELWQKKFEANQPLREALRNIRRAERNNETVSEEAYKQVVELSAAIKIKEAQLEQEYMTKFLTVVPAKKLTAYIRAEKDFGRQSINNRN